MAVKKESSIYRYTGLSTDTKPTSVPVGSTFYEYDTYRMAITYDGTNWVYKKSPSYNPINIVRSVKTLACSAEYAANDVLSESISTDKATHWTFSSIVDSNGDSGVITYAQALTECSSASGDLVLHLFSASPSCALTDNSANTAPSYNDITASKYIGKISFGKLASDSTTGEATAQANPYTASSGLPLPFTCASATTVIYGIAVGKNAFAVTASTDLMFALMVEKR